MKLALSFKHVFLGSVIAAAIFTAHAAGAATITLSPSQAIVAEGQNLSVIVTVNPQGAQVYTTSMEMNYPAERLELLFFSLDSGWLALEKSGYDLVDEAAGKIVKTGGFPQGFSSEKGFALVVFRAKDSGIGTISLGGNSFIFDAESTDVFVPDFSQTQLTVGRGEDIPELPFEIPDPVSPEYLQDTDQDLIPDGWETRNRLEHLNPGDACSDPDGDGLVNLQEYAFRFDPQDVDTYALGALDRDKARSLHLGTIDELKRGTTFQVTIPQIVTFSLQEEEYSITILEKQGDSVSVLYLPSCRTDLLTSVESRQDLNKDSEPDIVLALDRIEGNQATIFLGTFVPTIFDIVTETVPGEQIASRGLGIAVIVLMSAIIVLVGGYGIYRKIRKKNVT